MRRLIIAAIMVVTGFFAAACTPVAPEEVPPDPGAASEHSPEETTTPPPPPLPWGPTQDEVDETTAQAAELSDEELAGLVIVARYDGAGAEHAVALMEELHLGGVILFAPNIESLGQVQRVTEAVQGANAGLNRDWPAIVAVDNEGGIVQRLSGQVGPWTTFPPFAAAGEADAQVVQEAMEAMARELRASGLNTNYAPVADVTAPGDAAIGSRSPSHSPERAARAVAAAVEGFAAGGVLSSVKHFPGHGGLTTDSHEALPVQEATTADLEARDLIPFRAGIEAGAPMVMLGHIAVREWDGGAPASLSPVAYDYLRNELGFTGVTITDGLDMGALEGTSGEIAVRAVNAGADILLTPADARGARDGLLGALESGELDRERLEEAAGRVIAMMRHQRHLAEVSGPVGEGDVGSAHEAAQRLAGH